MITSIPYIQSAYSSEKPVHDIRLVKAAIRVDDKVYTGWRHAHIIQELAKSGSIQGPITQDQQGFIDQDGIFYRRVACSGIAFMNGQTKTFIRTLTSEDLWYDDGTPKQ